MEESLVVLGIGCTTPVFMDLAMDAGYRISALYHYNEERTGEEVHGYKIVGSFEDLFSKDIRGKHFLLTMGDMRIRKDLSDKIISRGGVIPTIIHPTAIVSRFARISSKGVIIAPYCIVQADVVLGDGVVMRDSALIGHTTIVGSFSFIGPKSLVGAKMRICEGAFIGQQSLLVSGKVKEVGNKAIVGAGAVVTKSVDNEVIVVGNPARVLQKHTLGGVKG